LNRAQIFGISALIWGAAIHLVPTFPHGVEGLPLTMLFAAPTLFLSQYGIWKANIASVLLFASFLAAH